MQTLINDVRDRCLARFVIAGKTIDPCIGYVSVR